MHRIVVVTGTPGTGKTTLARSLGRSIKGAIVIDANLLVKSGKLFSGHDEYGTMVADLGALSKRINRTVRAEKGTVVIEGHLLCDMKIRGAVAIVLRCHLKELKKRLLKRRYKDGKLRDNLVSEALDYCGARAAANYRNVFEIMGSREKMLKDSLSVINGRGRRRRIELSEELLGVIKEVV